MPANYLRHSCLYCLEYCSHTWEHTPSVTATIAGPSLTSKASRHLFFQNASQNKKIYMNGAWDCWRCTGRNYSPQFITSKMADNVDVEDDGDV